MLELTPVKSKHRQVKKILDHCLGGVRRRCLVTKVVLSVLSFAPWTYNKGELEISKFTPRTYGV